MAEKDKKSGDKTGKSKETALTEEEEKALLEAFKKLGAKPKVTSPAELKEWMAKYIEATTKTEGVKSEAEKTDA